MSKIAENVGADILTTIMEWPNISITAPLKMMLIGAPKELKRLLDALGKAAIEAISDPTLEMIEAGVKMNHTERSGSDETLVHDIWQAMIDAAISEV